MQGSTSGLGETCAACGGDPGGLVWEGMVLRGVLSATDIAVLLRDTLPYRSVVRLFASGQLHGFKLGKQWQIRASQFIKDWEYLEAASCGGPAFRTRPLFEVTAR